MSILCERILAVLAQVPQDDPAVDCVDIAWHELNKRAIGRRSRGGRMVRIVLAHDQRLEHGAVLARQGLDQIVINLLPCEVLSIDAISAKKLAQAAYAIGNLHIPAQIEDGKIFLPAEGATEAALDRLGISYRVETRRFAPIANVLPQLTISSEMAR